MNLRLLLATWLTMALSAHVGGAVVLDLDAAALPGGEIMEAPDKSADGRWNANVPLRVETVQGRSAFVVGGTEQLISAFTLPAGSEKAFTVEAWALNPPLE